MRTQRYIIRCVLALLPAMAAAGCDNLGGYSFAPPFPDDVRTVSVPMWHRSADVYRREIEQRLSEAIVKNIEGRTPYKVVSPAASPDTQLTGTIDRIEQRIIDYNPDTGRPRELEMTIFVSFEWKDMRTGKVRVERTNFSTSGTYIHYRSAAIRYEPEDRDFFQGSEDVINELARRIVEQLELTFGDEPPADGGADETLPGAASRP